MSKIKYVVKNRWRPRNNEDLKYNESGTYNSVNEAYQHIDKHYNSCGGSKGCKLDWKVEEINE